jgi:hypothetical protein
MQGTREKGCQARWLGYLHATVHPDDGVLRGLLVSVDIVLAAIDDGLAQRLVADDDAIPAS